MLLLFCNNNRTTSIKLKNKNVRKRRSGIISQPTEYLEDDEYVTYLKSKEEQNLIRTALENNDFLSHILQEKRLQHFIDCMYKQQVKEGETLITEGESGSHLYISNNGRFEITIQESFIDTFSDVRVFGELAILYSAKRHATITCLENGSVWTLDCPVFKKLIIKTAIEEQEEMVSFLKNVPKLNTASKEHLYQVTNLLKIEFFATAKEIVKQGEGGNKFYIIRAGSVTVIRNNDKVAQLGKGQFFGELALLKDDFRQATVVADAPGTECLTLTRKEFIDHFGEVDEFINLKMKYLDTEKVVEYTDVNLDEFEILKTLGIGGFGRVKLIRHKSYRDQVFALKCMQKMEIIAKSHQDQVYNEKNLQMACNSPFIVRMYRSFRDSKYVYLLLEVCYGGDLWNLLHKQKKRNFEESAAKFYSGCIVEALEYLHKRSIIYRDLKPENVMVHSNGYLKLTDFGFAKKIDSKEKTYTFVGTAEYVAPELIQNKGYNKAVDYWALGVFIFELLTGRTPFHTNDPGHLKTYKLILKGIDHVTFPYYISSKARSLIKKLCAHTPSDRLGCQRGAIEDIKSHPWFSSFNWSKLRNFEITPPFKPVLQHIVDTKYFENFTENKTVPLDDFSSWDNEF
uniref:cGMP-dependent protein kinase n=1 Tax=Anoplophora glabripennis TaxID=217634 RepID=V5GQA3_ANOGL